MPDLHPLDPSRIPPAIRAGLDRYANGIMPGDCLRAILAGDLYGAFTRADPDTAAAMPAIVAFVVGTLAAPYGTYERLHDWIVQHERRLMLSRPR